VTGPALVLKQAVEITDLKFNVDGHEGVVEARGYLRVNHGTCVRLHRLISPDDAAALEPILERIAEQVRGSIGEAMNSPLTRWYVRDGEGSEQTQGEAKQ
jgi:hypothetical protein